MSQRDTKDNENPPLPVAMLRSNGNPAPFFKGGLKSPPLEKGGKGGFERAFLGKKDLIGIYTFSLFLSKESTISFNLTFTLLFSGSLSIERESIFTPLQSSSR